MGNFDYSYLQKVYTRAQVKNDEIVTIASRSRQIGRLFHAWIKTVSPPYSNIAPEKDPSIKSGITQESDEDKESLLLVGESLALDLAGDDISLLGYKAYLTVFDFYPLGYESMGTVTSTGHTSA